MKTIESHVKALLGGFDALIAAAPDVSPVSIRAPLARGD